MITEQRKHRDEVARRDLTEMIEQGVECMYSYTHYVFKGKKLTLWDEERPLSKEEALAFMQERNPKRDDGFRFSPSRCFLYGYVRALRRPQDTKETYIMFSEADRKPTPQEQFDVLDGVVSPEEIMAKNTGK